MSVCACMPWLSPTRSPFSSHLLRDVTLPRPHIQTPSPAFLLTYLQRAPRPIEYIVCITQLGRIGSSASHYGTVHLADVTFWEVGSFLHEVCMYPVPVGMQAADTLTREYFWFIDVEIALCFVIIRGGSIDVHTFA